IRGFHVTGVQTCALPIFRSAGLFRMLQPTRHGGLECHPNQFFDVVTELAAACPSSAWVFGVIAVHAFQLALFPDEAQDEVWGKEIGRASGRERAWRRGYG